MIWIIKKIIKIISGGKTYFRLPSESDVLIFDAVGAEYLLPFLGGRQVQILASRGEEVNLTVCALALFKGKFRKKRLREAYFLEYIALVNPKLVVTFIDNNPFFYKISNQIPTTTMFVQNGIRSASSGAFLPPVAGSDYRVDHMLVFGKAIGNKYSHYIAGVPTVIGSLKNNAAPIHYSSKSRVLLFISQFRPQPKDSDKFFSIGRGRYISHDSFYTPETVLLNFLIQWAKRNNYIIRVCGCSAEKDKEKQFFRNIFGDNYFQFAPKSSRFSSYQEIDLAEVCVFVDSTLGYEALARGHKAAAISARGSFLHDQSRYFGWPIVASAKGPFWTNELAESEFLRILDFLHQVDKEDWDRIRAETLKDIMIFDPGNTRLSSLLKSIFTD